MSSATPEPPRLWVLLLALAGLGVVAWLIGDHRQCATASSVSPEKARELDAQTEPLTVGGEPHG